MVFSEILREVRQLRDEVAHITHELAALREETAQLAKKTGEKLDDVRDAIDYGGTEDMRGLQSILSYGGMKREGNG